jgi:hypothetical protein
MKRSEMIQIMKKASRILDGYSIHNPNFEEHLMDVILTAQESNGMLPPIEPGRCEQDLNLGVPDWEIE